MANTYTIEHSHGQHETGIESYELAEKRVRAVYPDCEIGHAGDIAEGGERTLVWRTEEESRDDDGARAVCEIKVAHD